MRWLWLFPLLLGGGCAATLDSAPDEFSNDPQQDLEIHRVWSRGDLSKFRMRNTSNRTVRYLHWFGQGPEPVAYCLREDGSRWTCSERVYLDGNEESGYFEWTHDTILRPRSTVTFRVRAGAGDRVGIKTFPVDSGEEVLVWARN